MRESNTIWKLVDLITPERARRVGLYAEGPVFVSPYVRGRHACLDCSGVYGPLVYGIGSRTESAHCAGIWHYGHGTYWVPPRVWFGPSLTLEAFFLAGDSDCAVSEHGGRWRLDSGCGAARWFAPSHLVVLHRPLWRGPACDCGTTEFTLYDDDGVLLPICETVRAPLSLPARYRLSLRDGIPLFTELRVPA